MTEVNAIFAHGLNGEFSLSDGSLPWKNISLLTEDARADMENFKSMTSGQIVIMGFNTYRTFSKPLPKRINIVLDKNCSDGGSLNKIQQDNFNFFSSVESALSFFYCEQKHVQDFSNKKIYIIGGAKLLDYALEKNLITGKIYETVFNFNFPEARTFVKPLSEDWKIIEKHKLAEHSVLLTKVLNKK